MGGGTETNPCRWGVGDRFGISVAISGNTAVIEANGDDERVSNSGSGYVYTNIIRKWTQNGKIVPVYGRFNEYFGYSVSLLGGTALFGDPLIGEENRGYAYIVDSICIP